LSVKIEEYLDSIIKFLRIHPLIKNTSIDRKIVTKNRGYVKATITFINDSQLHIREFINSKLRKINYAYHYQGSDGKLIFRYNSAPHHTEVKTFPHHKHTPNKPEPEPAKEKTIIDIVSEIAKTISKSH